MTDTKHSAERAAFEQTRKPRTDLATKNDKYTNPVVQACWETWQARAAIASAAPVRCMMCNGYGLVGCMTPEGGEGWPCPDCEARYAAMPSLTDEAITAVWHSMPGGPSGWLINFGYIQFAKAVEEAIKGVLMEMPTAAPKPALTDAVILSIVKEKYYPLWVAGNGDDIIGFGRAIEAASGPNAALVESLAEMIAYLTEPAGMTEAIAMDIQQMEAFFENLDKSSDATVAKARAALAAAGVEQKP